MNRRARSRLRVLAYSVLDGGLDAAHTLGAMGRSHTAATKSSVALLHGREDRTEEDCSKRIPSAAAMGAEESIQRVGEKDGRGGAGE